MFYDERIEYEKGNIMRGCIMLSVLIAAILGSLRVLGVILYINEFTFASPYEYFFTVMLEICTVISGTLCLAVGSLYMITEKDGELRKRKKSNFYNKAGKIHIFIMLASFAAASAAISNIGSVDSGFDNVIYAFTITLFAYCAYSFKKRDIYFNYSIMESGCYYKNVFLNILRFARFMFALLFISLVANVIISAASISKNALESMIAILGKYASVFFTVSLAYILYSYLEKTSYDKESPAFSRAPTVPLAIALVCTVIPVLYWVKILVSQKVPYTSSPAGLFVNACEICLAAFVTYFCYESQKDGKKKLISASALTFLFSASLLACATSFYLTAEELLMLRFYEAEWYPTAYKIFYHTVTWTKYLTSLAKFVSVTLMLTSLIERGIISDKHYFAPPVFAVICITKLIVRPLLENTLMTQYRITVFDFSVQAAVIAYILIIMISVSNKQRKV